MHLIQNLEKNWPEIFRNLKTILTYCEYLEYLKCVAILR